MLSKTSSGSSRPQSVRATRSLSASASSASGAEGSSPSAEAASSRVKPYVAATSQGSSARRASNSGSSSARSVTSLTLLRTSSSLAIWPLSFEFEREPCLRNLVQDFVGELSPPGRAADAFLEGLRDLRIGRGGLEPERRGCVLAGEAVRGGDSPRILGKL